MVLMKVLAVEGGKWKAGYQTGERSGWKNLSDEDLRERRGALKTLSHRKSGWGEGTNA